MNAPVTIAPLWDQKTAIALCRDIEMIAPLHGCHVALTGGCLYKFGERKDLDLLFYRVRQAPRIEITDLFTELEERLGIAKVSGFGWCIKAETREGRKIDCFFPEEQGNEEYPEEIGRPVEFDPDEEVLF